MAWNREWDESTPVGSTTNASDIDLWLRYLQIDVAERMESMFYGFNNSSSAAPEDAYGVKHLKLYPQTAPTAIANFGFLYGKDVSSAIELFFLPETGGGDEIQLTSGGKINGAALKDDSVSFDVIEGANNTYINQKDSSGTARGFLGVDDSDVIQFGNTNFTDARLRTATSSATDHAKQIADKGYVDGGGGWTPTAMTDFAAWETDTDVQYKVVYPNGLIHVFGHKKDPGGGDEAITMTGITNVFWASAHNIMTSGEAYHPQVKGISSNVVTFTVNNAGTITGIFYEAWGK